MANGTTLFDMPLSHRSDPVTSDIAAERHRASGAFRTQKEQVFTALLEHPGATSAELAQAMNVSRYLTARRLPDLRRDRRVRNGGKRLCRVVGAECETWYAGGQDAES